MEVDSMHSAIKQSRPKKFVPVCTINDWIIIFRQGKKKNPYKITEIKYGDFLDLLTLFANVKK